MPGAAVPDWMLHLQKSPARLAVETYDKPAQSILKSFLSESDGDSDELPDGFDGCVFVGHKATDLDSIGSAIACADLFGGIAARASEINSETAWAVKRWGFEVPPLFADVAKDMRTGKNKSVVLVDHNQVKQMADGVDPGNLKGCMDHHAIQGEPFSTSDPIFVLIQPWGSCCTIVADLYCKSGKKLKKEIAGLLLCGILSDTLNLRSPTTKRQDKKYVAALAKCAGIDDIDLLAKDLFKAKSQELLHMSASQIVMGDLKSFSMNCGNGKTMEIAFGVVETTDTDPLVLRREELSFELTAYKAENKKDACFLALVNIQGLFSMLITVGPIEQAIARGSYPDGKFEETTGLYSLGSRVSRKKEFIPPLQNFFTKGWTPPQEVEEEKGIAAQDLGELVHECSPEEGIGCRIVRRKSLQLDQILVRRKSLELIPPSASLESKSAQ